MRIIGGHLGGQRLTPPSSLPVRPTTDIAKEALFNILENRLDIENCTCLDLFTGTGNISFELSSRGAVAIDAVDIHFKCVQYIKETAKKLNINNIQARKADVLKFISACRTSYDLIFADPPYDLPQLPGLANDIWKAGILNAGGIMVIEHPSTRGMADSPIWVETRKYGYSSFSFYQNDH
ncbi:16S rRNA (guanine(966)-N(2))-methyltransferase RsmD [Sphingobacterium allocomposti]|jgi:16S rRNA (guanine966-N2)-methyltransferase|uniref:16S rRNA (Guanine(966)-N(2))-methyltransferase RsmD n=1 Tax=Sphingobacterium allocomposti TaxID=415956 RepID=A0A5S5DFB9_9SPHI|nr:RsmD family RNA methyltransferase [Sphingobacterium composti Yoo et al. 2007 non Ten et al. 2007]TYP94365.1 16S rRNA (guanine(966)-N(2))-methyltransferase RsmD [Sphingobacterium composti Yoo et al. 2007 non Ten et al. 2007]HLS94410.1 RsmD family RNA methyltransferase [Sphingobacterium sp.]